MFEIKKYSINLKLSEKNTLKTDSKIVFKINFTEIAENNNFDKVS